jgi:hypothetical protein
MFNPAVLGILHPAVTQVAVGPAALAVGLDGLDSRREVIGTEVGAVAAEQATVRVTYTLRQDQETGRWLIVESEQMAL